MHFVQKKFEGEKVLKKVMLLQSGIEHEPGTPGWEAGAMTTTPLMLASTKCKNKKMTIWVCCHAD
jgi:hypothetical protein